jgi:hypothetical protein
MILYCSVDCYVAVTNLVCAVTNLVCGDGTTQFGMKDDGKHRPVRWFCVVQLLMPT